MNQPDAAALVKQSIALSAVVGRYVSLKRRSNRLVGLCPFHSDSAPSFYVDDQRGFYHCFGCNKGGDVIHFVQEIEKLSFPEALDFLADLAGIELPRHRVRGPGKETVDALRAIQEEAVQFFSARLKRHDAARQYLEERGVRPSTWKLFRLGYADGDWDSLYAHLEPRYSPELLGKSGLFKQARQGRIYDAFRDRIMFPISDVHGHVIAFGGRRMGEEGPKYINSPETPLYTKGRHVYNLHLARPFLKKDPRIIVVEGYMDAIQVYQAGVGNVVASLGTAFTQAQAKLLRRYASRIVLNFDADPAGFKAARTSIETLLGERFDVRVMSLDQGQDPDDFIRTHGVEQYREILDHASPFLTFLLDFFGHHRQFDGDPNKKSEAIHEICQSLQCISDPVLREHFQAELAEAVGTSLGAVRAVARAFKAPQVEKRRAPASKRVGTQPRNRTEEEFIFLSIQHPDLWERLSEEQQAVTGQVLANRETLTEFIKAGDLDFSQRLAILEPSEQEKIRALTLSEDYTGDLARLPALIHGLSLQFIDLRIQEINAIIRNTPADQEEKLRRFLVEQADWSRKRHALVRNQRLSRQEPTKS